MTTDEKYMKQAIKQAKKAYAIDEVLSDVSLCGTRTAR